MTVADQSDVRAIDASGDDSAAERGAPYVSRILIQHLASNADKRAWMTEVTAGFVDISRFTKVSRALARKGRVGAE